MSVHGSLLVRRSKGVPHREAKMATIGPHNETIEHQRFHGHSDREPLGRAASGLLAQAPELLSRSLTDEAVGSPCRVIRQGL